MLDKSSCPHPLTKPLTVAQLEKRLAASHQTVWRWYTNRDFPKPHYLGQNRVWFESQVEAWERRKMASLSTPPAVGSKGTA